MMPAAKHGDVQMGVDIHLCTVPTPAPTPLPLPTPHMSVVFDPFDYVPVIGATITVCGMKRATAGTAGKVVHIPPGFPFAPKLPDTEDELFMGSATVVADGDPMSHIAHPVLSCQAAGMMSPFRLKKKGGPRAMVLPTVFNLATPTTVFVGGPPTISLMGMAMKGVFAGLGKLARSGVFKRLRQKLFKNMKPGFLKCVVLRAEPVNILSGAVSVEQLDFELPGRLPLDWVRCYDGAATGHVGVCGPGWQTLLDLRLEVDPADGVVTLHGPQVGPLLFDRLPAGPGDAGLEREWSDGARLTDEGDAWQVRTKDDRLYRFPKALAARRADGIGTVPIGRLADRCGNGWDVEYRGGRPWALVESAGRRLALAMADGRLAAVTLVDAATGTDHGFVRYEYDAAGDLVAVIDAMGAPYRFDYGRGDTAHHLLRHTDRVGLSFHYAYEPAPDGTQRVVHAWGDGGLYDYRFEYLDALNQRRITDSLGHASLVQLDDRGLPINEIDPLGGMTVYEYDDAGRTTAVVDAAGRRTAYAFDGHGNLVSLTRPDGQSVRTVFDDDDRVVAITDPTGATWRQRYDARGCLVAQASPLDLVTRCEYDAHGMLAAWTNPRGARTRVVHDAGGQPAEIVDALGGRSLLEHDVLGRLVRRTTPDGAVSHYRYDATGRLVAAVGPDGARTGCVRDAQGRLVEYIDERGGRTRFEYAGTGWVVRRTGPDGASVRCEYDTEGRLVAVHNPRGQTSRLRRDALGRVVEDVDYWGQSRRFELSSGGDLVAMRDPIGRRIDYTCDLLGRIVKKTLADPGAPGGLAVETFEYDSNGHLLAAANAHGRLERAFDAAGRLLHERQVHADGACFELSNAYDEAGNRTERVVSGGEGRRHVVRWTFDPLDRPTAVAIDDHPATRMQWDAAGRVVAESLAPSLVRRFAYDPAGRLAAQVLEHGGRRAGAVRYAYDAMGNLAERQDDAGARDAWAYDPAGRLREHLEPGGEVLRFVRDAAGELLDTVTTDEGLDRPWQREGCAGGATYRFDRAGQLVHKQSAGVAFDFAWDGNQRLVASRRSDRDGARVTRYGYDPLGRRLFKETGGRRVRFGWDGDALGFEWAPGSSSCYVYRTDGFEPTHVLRERVGAVVLRFIATEPNGQGGRLVPAPGEDDDTTPLRLQGQYHDDETGLAYNRHRYFDAALEAFVTQDPLRLVAGSQLYAYAPNTTAWSDPLGLNPTCRLTGHAVTNATHLPVVRQGTRQWDEAVDALRRGGRGDIRVETIQDAKALLREARGNMDRHRNYTDVVYRKGYEVHNVHTATSRAREMAVGNDLRHVKWVEGTSKADWSEGHIFFGAPL